MPEVCLTQHCVLCPPARPPTRSPWFVEEAVQKRKARAMERLLGDVSARPAQHRSALRPLPDLGNPAAAGAGTSEDRMLGMGAGLDFGMGLEMDQGMGLGMASELVEEVTEAYDTVEDAPAPTMNTAVRQVQ